MVIIQRRLDSLLPSVERGVIALLLSPLLSEMVIQPHRL